MAPSARLNSPVKPSSASATRPAWRFISAWPHWLTVPARLKASEARQRLHQGSHDDRRRSPSQTGPPIAALLRKKTGRRQSPQSSHPRPRPTPVPRHLQNAQRQPSLLRRKRSTNRLKIPAGCSRRDEIRVPLGRPQSGVKQSKNAGSSALEGRAAVIGGDPGLPVLAISGLSERMHRFERANSDYRVPTQGVAL